MLTDNDPLVFVSTLPLFPFFLKNQSGPLILLGVSGNCINSPGLTLLLASWLSWQDLTKSYYILATMDPMARFLLRSYQDESLFQDRILLRLKKF